MQKRKLILLLLFIFSTMASIAQKGLTYDEVNIKSYDLFEKGVWKELLKYGKEAIKQGEDFVLLRLRMGYAAFMLNNFSEAIKQYSAVIKKDKFNETAHYYSWLCLKYLNQNELAGIHVKYFSKDLITKEKLHPIAITGAGLESSFKTTDYVARGNSIYARVDVSNRWNWNVNMNQGFALYNQKISEKALTGVINNNNIDVNQKEYYNRLAINLAPRWQLKTVYHYVYTPFNNYTYQNQAGMAGVRYHGNYFDLQADMIYAKITDTTQQQYDLQIGIYPLGNLNFYGYSTAMFRNRNDVSGFNFKQVIGFKLLNKVWLEGNATFGSFSNLFENDALYLYNAIDKNLYKAGAVLYYSIGTKMTAQAGYTFEKREIYKKINTFNQHSITGGLSWKF